MAIEKHVLIKLKLKKERILVNLLSEMRCKYLSLPQVSVVVTLRPTRFLLQLMMIIAEFYNQSKLENKESS